MGCSKKHKHRLIVATIQSRKKPLYLETKLFHDSGSIVTDVVSYNDPMRRRARILEIGCPFQRDEVFCMEMLRVRVYYDIFAINQFSAAPRIPVRGEGERNVTNKAVNRLYLGYTLRYTECLRVSTS